MKQLSLVIQGPVQTKEQTLEQFLWQLQRVRDTFPLAEIIVSSWDMADAGNEFLADLLSHMDITLVLSDDPGPIIGWESAGKHLTNVNRQLVSTRAGLNAATRELVIKLRTDCYLTDRSIVRLLEQHVAADDGFIRDNTFSVFSQRVITASWIARDARGSLPFLFHPGDIFLAGRTEDIKVFFNSPLATQDLFMPTIFPGGLWCAWRYVPEQWLWVHAIKKVTGKSVFDGNSQRSEQLISLSEQYFLANFIAFNPEHLGLRWPKFQRKYKWRGAFSVYSYSRWLRLYKRYNGVKAFTPRALASYLITRVWRWGYIIRARLLCCVAIRRVVLSVFIHRSE
ncbi:hypothetical protein I5682_02895 [Citrobacter werkmanii]|nr:WavE lipopolysaccharide synthesis family protein [Citrobacter werkmanii]MBJ9597319.1 hypothetical protein [Citrobacter werkmanii]MBJ9871446.1 hypothetical protein [Citrobacter werkmanii]HEB0856373.1 hypothetical protein [Citrobacter freundii]